MAEPRRAQITAIRVERLHMTRTELATKVGISYNHMWGIERGNHPASIELLYKIADALGATIDEVMVRIASAKDDESKPKPERKARPTPSPEPTGPAAPPRKSKGRGRDAAEDVEQVAS